MSFDKSGRRWGPESVVFGVVSDGYRPEAVSELAGLLAPFTVHVHHDFERFAHRSPQAPNLRLVDEPVRTGWGTWGFARAVARLMRAALDAGPFDYFQLLSPTCLPLKPVAQFADFVAADRCDAHLSLVDLLESDDAVVEFGFRTFAPGGSTRKRLLRHARHRALGADRTIEYRAGLAISRPASAHRRSLVARLARGVTAAAVRGRLGPHPFDSRFRPYMGSTWFGARRHVIAYLVDAIEDPASTGYFRDLDQPDELLFATLLGNADLRLGPLNHLVNRFSPEGHPLVFAPADLSILRESDRWFARKFADDPADPVRRAQIGRVRGAEVGEDIDIRHATMMR